MQTLQIYECSECLYHFTAGTPGKDKTYPLRAILDAISIFKYRLFSDGHTAHHVRRAHIEIPARTLQEWLKTYRPLCTYNRLRTAANRLYPPETIVRTLELEHRQLVAEWCECGVVGLLEEQIELRRVELEAVNLR